MKDLWVDANGNFVKTLNKDLQLTPDDVAYVIQKLQIVLKTFYGEYFLDTMLGLPYFPNPAISGYVSVFGKNPNTDSIAALFKAAILAQPLVGSLTSFLMQFDSQAKKLSVSFIAKLVSGAVIDTTITAP